MQYVYACHLPYTGGLPGLPGRAWKLVEDWCLERFGIELPAGGGGQVAGSRARAEVVHLCDGPAELRRLDLEHPHSQAPGWLWRITLWVGRDLSGAWARCLIGVTSTDDTITQPPLVVKQPGVIPRLLDLGGVTLDGRPTGSPWPVSSGNVHDLVGLIRDGDRALPVVVASPDPSGQLLLDAGALAAQLAGIAHVVTLSTRQVTFTLTEELGAELSVFGGAVRIYWPGLSKTDNPLRHPYYAPAKAAAIGPDRLLAMVTKRIGGVAALALQTPPLETRLRHTAVVRQQRELEQLQERAAAGALENAEFTAELERLIDLERALTDANETLRSQVGELEQQLQVAEQNFRAVAEASPGDDDDLLASAPASPATVLEAVDLAAKTCQHLVFLPEAFSSAQASAYSGSPIEVLAALQRLDAIAAGWQRGALEGRALRGVFAEAGESGYRSGISQTARQKYESDYARDYNGTRVLLGPHIAHGAGRSANQILRIYWYCDDEQRVYVVGHVGGKLRDVSNS